MDKNKFTEKDKEKFVEFLNFVAKHAEFKLNTGELISYYGALSHMQQVMLPKIDSHILEIKKIVEADKNESGDKE
jgi:hypothetical protein